MDEKSWKQRQSEREHQDRRDLEILQKKAKKTGIPLRLAATNGMLVDEKVAETDKLLELMTRAESLIEQVNTLYQQYFLRVEKLPPLERRKQLESIMDQMKMMKKPTPQWQFRYISIQQHFQVYRDKWERQLKDWENKGGARKVA